MYTNIRTIWVYTYIVVRTHAGYEETYCEETWKSYTAPAATDDFAAAGFGGRGRSAGGAAAIPIPQAKQETDPVVSGCRRSGMVQERGAAGLPDEDQSSAVGANEGRENEFGRMSWPLWTAQYSSFQVDQRARPSGAWTGHPRDF